MSEYQDYRIEFTDGTYALIVVGEDEKPADVAVEWCEVEGWDTNDITAIILQPIDSIAAHQSMMSQFGNF